VAAVTAVGADRLVVRGEVRVPGDKSISHRSLIFAALAHGPSEVRGVLRSDDLESTARVLRALGVEVPPLAADLRITGRGRHGLRAPDADLHCGNSGTTARLMMGVVAAQPFGSTFTGDASLSRRPMRRVTAPLAAMGAHVDSAPGRDGLPLTIHGGALRGIEWRMEAASAQVKSAVLLAGFCAGVEVVVVEPSPTRDHSERFLRRLGADVSTVAERITLRPGGELAPFALDVPGDPSAAAFFAALGALADEGEVVLRHVGLNPGRTGFLEVLRRMGASIEVTPVREQAAEPAGDLVVRPAPLRATAIGPAGVASMIDELPVLACVAARADGVTVIRGAGELRVKESDRIGAVVAGLRAVGVEADELLDGMRIQGTRSPLSGPVRTRGDHRLAMAFGVLGASAHGDIVVDDPDCVGVSYPDFWRDLARVIA
jgi:3-phosphoshikimate 1-carboxyvinyltransferase